MITWSHFLMTLHPNAIVASKSYRNEYQYYWRAMKRYGLSKEDINEMLLQQGNACKICLEPFIGKRPCLDHCHDKGHFRGLLCDSCNKGLGDFRDNIQSLLRAADYLNESLSETTPKKAYLDTCPDYIR